MRSWDFSARLGVVARPCEASWEARRTISIVCGPFAVRGAKGEAEYPWKLARRYRCSLYGPRAERHGAGVAGARSHHSKRESRQWYGFCLINLVDQDAL